ncbi:MAG: tetratricopeptide repeat protein [Alphaproteobacteria bacterium]|nr:MAG: tetratricopeptide repeat protein [Alphaproteobacteria bacterium]
MKLFGKKDDAPADAPELDSPDETAAAETDMGADMGADPGGFAEPSGEEIPGDAPTDETALAAPARGPVGGGGNKKKMMAAGGLLALLVLGGGAGYYYFVMMDEGTAPLQPAPPAVVAAVPPAPATAAPVAPANPAAVQPAATSPANDPLNSANPGNFAGSPAQPALAEAPGATPAAVPAESAPAATAPAGLGPTPGDEATAVPLTPGAPPPAGTETSAAGPAGIEAPAEEPPQDLPMPAMPAATAPVDNSAAPVAAMPGAPAGTGAAPPAAAANGGATAGGTAVPPNGAQATAVPGGKPAAPGKPSDAEMAIVQNAAVLDQLSTQAAPGQPNRPFDPNQAPPDQSTALRTVDQLLEQPAIVRPLPLGWLTVRKEHESEDVDTRLTVARAALAQNNNKSALQLFNDLKKKYPKDKRILMGRAVTLQKLGQYDAALSAYEAVLNNDPKNLEALTNMLGLLKLKDPALALEKLEQLRDAYPYNGDITAQLGIAYAGAGRFEDGLRLLEMAEALNPGSAYVLYNKAVLYDKMGRSRQAGDLYRQIMRLAANGDLDQDLPLDAIQRRLAVLR